MTDPASFGIDDTKNDFYSIIMASLLPSYDSYISAVNATLSVLGTTISANNLMLTLTEEYKCHTLKTKGGKKDNNARKDHKGESSLKKNVKCHNCGKKGHYKADCWVEGGEKEGQGLKQKGKGEKGKEKEKDSAFTAQDKKEDKLKSEEAKEVPDTSFDTAYLTGTNETSSV